MFYKHIGMLINYRGTYLKYDFKSVYVWPLYGSFPYLIAHSNMIARMYFDYSREKTMGVT